MAKQILRNRPEEKEPTLEELREIDDAGSARATLKNGA
jgi:hypothetical protein